MARAVKRKRPSKRVRLAAALREAMDPLMRAHGFDHPPKDAPSQWSNIFPRVDYWQRWVGENRQAVYAYWPWRNSFRLVWTDDAINRVEGYGVDFYLQSWRIWPLSPTIRGTSFSGFRPIRSSVRLATRRMEALLRYWETGETSPYLGLDAPVRQLPWSEEESARWLDPKHR